MMTESANSLTVFVPIATAASYAIYPINERRNKLKECFINAHDTLLEIHKNQKEAKSGKAPKHLVLYSDVFNVSTQTESLRFKGDCLCIMDISETYLILPADSSHSVEDWKDWILERVRECRSNKVLRPVLHSEFFEAAFDVIVTTRPKLKKDYSSREFDDLVQKKTSLEGRHRLCICSTSFLVFEMGSRPTPRLDTPFEKTDFINLPLSVISNYGCQEKYFFVRIGRHSEIGSGELWMRMENGESAKAMHEKINEINIREADKRREQGQRLSIPIVSESVLKNRAHRERSLSQNQSKRSQNRKLTIAQPNLYTLRETEDGTDAAVCSNNERGLSPSSHRTSCFSNTSASDKQSSGAESKQSPNTKRISLSQLFSSKCKFSISHISQTSNSNCSSARNSLINNLFGRKMNRNDSASATSSLADIERPESSYSAATDLGASKSNSVQIDGQAQQNNMQKSNYDDDDFMNYDPKEETSLHGHSASLGSASKCSTSMPHYFSSMSTTLADSRRSSGFSGLTNYDLFRNSAAIESNSLDPNKLSYAIGAHRTKIKGHGQLFGADYVDMNMNYGAQKVDPLAFPLQEVHSYISNSSESFCLTPPSSSLRTNLTSQSDEGDTNSPRAYSLGSRPTINTASTPSSEPSVSSELSGIVTSPHGKLLHPTGGRGHLHKRRIRSRAETIGEPSPRVVQQQHVSNSKQRDVFQQPKKREFEGIKSIPLTEDKIVHFSNNARETESRLSATNTTSTTNTQSEKPSGRKRAYSYGSKLIRSSLRHKKERKRAGSDAGQCSEIDRSLASSSTPFDYSSNGYLLDDLQQDDHVEIDFDQDSCLSLDSLCNHSSMHSSRHSSIGVQMGIGVKTALEFALSKNRRKISNSQVLALLYGEKPSDKLINLEKKLQEQQQKEKVPGQDNRFRKCSVPEFTQRQKSGQEEPVERISTPMSMIMPEKTSSKIANNSDNNDVQKHSQVQIQPPTPVLDEQDAPFAAIEGNKCKNKGLLSSKNKSDANCRTENTTKGSNKKKHQKEPIYEQEYVYMNPPKNHSDRSLSNRASPTVDEPHLITSKSASNLHHRRQRRASPMKTPILIKTSNETDMFEDYGIILPIKKSSLDPGPVPDSPSEPQPETDRSLSPNFKQAPMRRARSPTVNNIHGSSANTFHRLSSSPSARRGNSKCGSFSQNSSPVMSLKRRIDAGNSGDADLIPPSSPTFWTTIGTGPRKISIESSNEQNSAQRKPSTVSISFPGHEQKGISQQLLYRLKDRHMSKSKAHVHRHSAHAEPPIEHIVRSSSAERTLETQLRLSLCDEDESASNEQSSPRQTMLLTSAPLDGIAEFTDYTQIQLSTSS